MYNVVVPFRAKRVVSDATGCTRMGAASLAFKSAGFLS